MEENYVNLDYMNNQIVEEVNDPPMSVGDFVLTLLALWIPCAGFILYIYWAVASNVNKNRQNFCRAALIVMGISAVIGIILSIVFGVIFAQLMSEMQYMEYMYY